jgi:hypothetical protein
MTVFEQGAVGGGRPRVFALLVNRGYDRRRPDQQKLPLRDV